MTIMYKYYEPKEHIISTRTFVLFLISMVCGIIAILARQSEVHEVSLSSIGIILLFVFIAYKMFKTTQKRGWNLTAKYLYNKPLSIFSYIFLIIFVFGGIGYYFVANDIESIAFDPDLMFFLALFFFVASVLSATVSITRILNNAMSGYKIIGAKKYIGMMNKHRRR